MSGSSLPRWAVCPASGALPQVKSQNEQAAFGSAGHMHMQHRVTLGVQSAMERIDECAKAWGLSEEKAQILAAVCRGFVPRIPIGALGEVALCLREGGEVARVRGGAGTYYEVPPDGVVAGTVDCMWSEPEPLDLSDPMHPKCPKGSTLWVGDFKFGSEDHVEPVERNAQIGAYAVMAAKFTGAEEVVPAIIFARKGEGDWDTPPLAWGRAELDAAEKRTRAIVEGVREARRLLAEHKPLPLLESSFCTYCPAYTSCPAKVALVKQAAIGQMGHEGRLLDKEMTLTDAEVQWLANRLAQIEKFGKAARELLKRVVDESGPIPLDGGLSGMVWGPVESQRTVILPQVVEEVLAAEIGDAFAAKAIEQSTSRELITEAIKASLEAQGKKRGVAPIMRKVMAKTSEAGGLLSTPRVEYRVHRAEEETDETPGDTEAT